MNNFKITEVRYYHALQSATFGNKVVIKFTNDNNDFVIRTVYGIESCYNVILKLVVSALCNNVFIVTENKSINPNHSLSNRYDSKVIFTRKEV